MNTAAFALGALVALESFPGTLVALALAGALVALALAGAFVDLAFMDIFNLRDDAGCRMPKYGSNASSLVSCALANGTAAAKQRMATTAMDSFIAMVGREPSRMVCVLCCCMCCCVCMC